MAEKRNSAAAPLTIATIAILLPIVYVLSIGPVARLANYGRASNETVRRINGFYKPLIKACSRTGTLPILEAYVEWWDKL
jgi:hypothetical protein